MPIPALRPLPDAALPGRGQQDALSALMDSQDAIRRLRLRIESLAALNPADGQLLRGRLNQRLCLEMAVLLQVEEELLYPHLRLVADDPAPVDLAIAAHRRLRRWVEKLNQLGIDDPRCDRHAHTLAQLFDHHLRHQVMDLHALAAEVDLDWQALGQRIQHRRNDLLVSAAEPGAWSH